MDGEGIRCDDGAGVVPPIHGTSSAPGVLALWTVEVRLPFPEISPQCQADGSAQEGRTRDDPSSRAEP
jgi:hypothetical protein